MKELRTLSINGEDRELAIPHHWTLLEVLRYEAQLTGSKQGCDKGDCGACTVLLDGEPVLSCCTLAMQAVGREVRTIEGIANGVTPAAIQQAFDVTGALQCGFCQPGMIMSAAALLEKNDDPSIPEIQEALSGNLCRCTGYTKIYEAVQLAAKGLKQPVERVTGTPTEGFTVIGSRARKLDAIGKATGATQYADDIQLPGMLHGKILRSPHAHARIRSIDTSAAEAMKGVKAVMVGAELPTSFGVIPWTPDEHALCIDKVRYIGDGVAAVAAVDEETANRAIAAIEVDYELLEPVLDPRAALEEGAPLVHDEDWKGRPRKTNLCKKVELSFGEVDAALESAAAKVSGTWRYSGSTHAPIEPHCAIGRWEPDGRLTVWSATQVSHYLHRELAKVLDVPETKIRVIQPALGGAFGGKSEPFDLEFCVAVLAKKAGRPVKILYTREEVFYAHRGRHPMEFDFTIAADAEGNITAVENDIVLDGGSYHSFGLVTTYYAGQLLPGPIRFGSYRYRSRRAYTTKPACGPKRGHGSVQPRFPLETAIDELAEQLGMDPIAIRRVNGMVDGEETITGMKAETCGILQCLDSVEAASGWLEKHGKLPDGRGVGVATSMYISGTNYPIYPNKMPQSSVVLRGDRSGTLTIFAGTNDIGQGSDSMLAIVVAEETGVPMDDIIVVSADTDLTPVDLGAYSSRITLMAGTAAKEAGGKLRKRMVEAVAAQWEVPTEQVGVRPGEYYDTDEPEKVLPVREVLWLTESASGTLAEHGGYWTKDRGGDYRGGTIGASPAYSATAHVAEVSVDENTGKVTLHNIWAAHDCGRALNRTLVEGQIEGSVYMGASEALTEDMTYRDDGLHFGPNLLDYRILTSLDTPLLEADIVETVDPAGPYGAKEAGEGPLHPAIPAIANAIFDAVGVRLREMPFTPERVLAAIQAKHAAE
ncbi:MAG: molybdopterin-dependent oxidoreductase [Proteobacteria bacterium]|nr:molybdopterin-dependent oxidoreductase [Pseudomonadota bacterium]